jgi:hypothetical protein
MQFNSEIDPNFRPASVIFEIDKKYDIKFVEVEILD